MRTEWPQSFEKAVLSRLSDDKPLAPDDDLFKRGLDSLETMSLIIDLEDTFGIAIPDDRLTPETFGTPAGLWAVVAAELTARSGEH